MCSWEKNSHMFQMKSTDTLISWFPQFVRDSKVVQQLAAMSYPSHPQLKGHFFFLLNMKFHSKKNRNTTEISKPSHFKRGWEILREIHNRIGRGRSQFGQRVSCHIGLMPNPTEITNTKLRCQKAPPNWPAQSSADTGAELRCSLGGLQPLQNFNFSWESIGKFKLSSPKK